jgi:hypothetical protein
LWIAKPTPPPRLVGRQEAKRELAVFAADVEILIENIGSWSTTASHSYGGRRAMAVARFLKKEAEAARTCEIVEPKQGGRPKTMRTIQAAIIVVDAFEGATSARIDLPANSRANSEKPKVLEPLVREVFQVIGIKASPKAAIHAALIERRKQERANCSGQAPERHGITSDEFFERMQRIELARNVRW